MNDHRRQGTKKDESGRKWLGGRESLAWPLENLHKSAVFRQVAQLPTLTTRLAVAGAFVDSPPLSGFASAMTLAMTLDANDSGTSSGRISGARLEERLPEWIMLAA